ncbi:MAG: DUF4178 domain-containing protein [Flavobacteriaceae bacterium]
MFGNNDNFEINKLKVGYTFTYNKTDWKIIEIGEYYWKTGESSTEYTIVDDLNRTAFLEVELYKGDFELYFSEETVMDKNTINEALENEELVYMSNDYELDESYEGSYKSITNKSARERLTSHVFYHKKRMFTIEEWNEDTQVFYGEEIKVKHIKNIKSN